MTGNFTSADSDNDTIRKITPEASSQPSPEQRVSRGKPTASARSPFPQPMGIAAMAMENVFVSDRGNSTIRKITPAGVGHLRRKSSLTGNVNAQRSAARFFFPLGIVFDPISRNSCCRWEITQSGIVGMEALTTERIDTESDRIRPVGLGSRQRNVIPTSGNVIKQLPGHCQHARRQNAQGISMARRKVRSSDGIASTR